MKKILSVLLAVMLILGAVYAPLSVSADGADYELGNELVTNGDFSASAANTRLEAICSNNAYTIARYIEVTPNQYSKWFRPTAGVALAADAYANGTTTPDTSGEYPVYFKQNDTVLAQPDNTNNNVLRVVQSTAQYANVTANTTYKLSFRYKIGGKQEFYSTASSAKKQIRFYLGAFTPVKSGGEYTDKISSSSETLIPIKSTDFSAICDEQVSLYNGAVLITATPDNNWHTAEIIFTTGDRNLNTTADFDADGDGTIDASLWPMLTFYQEIGNAVTVNQNPYIENAFYLDDVSLKEVKYTVANIGNAEIYDAKGNLLTNNENITTSQVKSGNNLLVTVNYSKAAGLKFVGWYNGNTEVTNSETLTVSADDTTLYTPRFTSRNLSFASASFEGFESGTSLTHTDRTTNFPTGALWGGIKTAGYRGQTFAGTFYDNQGNEYEQAATGSYSQATTTKVTSDYSFSGNNSLYFEGAAWAFGHAIEGVEPGKTYTVSYMVKRDPTVTSRTHIKATAVLTTLNIGYAPGVNENFNNHICNLYNNLSLVNRQNINISNDAWNLITMEFTVPEKATNLTTVYLVMDSTGNGESFVNQFYIDDLVVLEKIEEINIESIPVEFYNAKGEQITSTNSYGEVIVNDNGDGTVNLEVKYTDSFAYNFLGFYDDADNLVSKETAIYNIPATDAVKYVAKIKDTNIYAAASYEGYSAGANLTHTNTAVPFPINGEWGGFAWDGYRKQTVAGTIYDNQGNAYTQTASGSYSNGVTATVSADYAHSGTKSLLLKGRYWTMVSGINNVKPGKTYEFSMWVKNDPTQTESKQLKGAAILTTVNIGQNASILPTHITEAYSKIGLPWDDGKNYQSSIPLSSDGWTKLSTRFTVPAAATELDTVYISLDASGADAVNSYNIYVDDISVSEIFDGIKTAYNSAAALRTADASTTGKNGMRIYNKIELDFIEDYGIKEYGSVAVLNSNLDGELTLETEKSVKGVAYNAETKPTATLFDQTETANIYTSYLSNIPEKRYGEQYVIRAYAIDGTGFIHYGESITVSAYDVAFAMDNGNGLEAQTETDIKAFKYFAGGKDGTFTMYDNWLKKSELKFAGKLRNIAKAEDTLSGDALTAALEIDGYYEPFFERAIANVGNRAMLKAMFEKAARGEDITVVGFGGSITQGAACTNELDSYSHLVAVWLREQFPNITVNWYNAGIGSTTSVLGIARMTDHVLAYNPDLVLLDFTTNDQTNDYHAGSYEAILRTLYEKQIAVVTITFGNVNNDEYKADGTCHRGTNREALHGPVMLYNDVPVIDYYGVMWDCYLDADGDGYNVDSDAAHWKTLWADYIHPTKIGHKLAANAINHYLGKVLDDLNNITETITYPESPFDKYTENFIGSMMYGEANVGALLTDSANVTIGTYSNYDSTTVSNWTIWQVEAGGYVEFTVDKCKMFALMSVRNSSAPKAEIYINDVLDSSHTASQASGELNWMNYIKFFDGSETVKVKIKCVSGTYRITSALIAK